MSTVYSEIYYSHDGFTEIKDVSHIENRDPPQEIKDNKEREYVDSWQNNGIRRVQEDDWENRGTKEGYAIYEEGIDPNDIDQGKCGSCWFLAALGVLSEDTTYVQSLILEEYAAQRCYGIQLYQAGRPVIQWIDDKFPVKGGKPIFVSSKEKKEIWVMLMEKAYAKMNGSYKNIEGGHPGDALNDLTGCPIVRLSTKDSRNSEVWEQMTKVTNESGESLSCTGMNYSPMWTYLSFGLRQYIIRFWRVIYNVGSLVPYLGPVIHFIFAVFAFAYNPIFCWIWEMLNFITCGILDTCHLIICLYFVGLVPGHAYSILEVKGSLCTKLVKVRNPWGRTEYKGWYSDNSICWKLRPRLAEELGIVKEDDGSFWMHLNDFCAYFDDIETCYILSEIKALRIEGKISKLEVSIPFLVNDEKTDLCVQINQKRIGGDRDKMVNWRLRVVEEIGSKFSSDNTGLVDNRTSSNLYKPYSTISTGFIKLKPGRYVILIDCHPCDIKDVKRDGGVNTTLSIHSKHCERVEFANPEMNKCSPKKVRNFIRGEKV